MTTDLDRIAEALRQADAAGDVEAARKLASHYRQVAQAAPAQPEPEQPGRLGSFASSVGRGALSVVPGTIGGIGYLTGQEGLVETAEGIEGGINRMLPVNPAYENEFLMKAGGALGQAGGMLLTGGVTGAAGKALAASRGLQTAQAAAKGTQLARNVLTGTGVLQGARGGGQAAEQYGMQGGTAYARALLGGAIEGLSERALFGMGTELAPVKKFLGDAAEKGVGGIAKAAGTEAGEEAAAQIGGNLATSVLAPYGVQTPGALEGAGEAALLGGIAGGALGGVNALMQPSPTIEGEAMIPAEVPVAPEQPETDEFRVEAFRQEMAQIAQNPDPIVPLQTAVNKTAEASVMQNADVLPATAAVIEAGGLAPTPIQEETPVGAPVEEQPASGVLLPQTTREEEIAQARERLRAALAAQPVEERVPNWIQVESENALASLSAEQTAAVEQLASERKTAKEIAQSTGLPVQTVTAARVALRIPPWTTGTNLSGAAVEAPEFTQWLSDYQKRTATAREQPEPEPPVIEETVAPEQPISAVEEATAAETTPEQVQNVENVIDEPGAAEVGSGMENIPEIPSAVAVAIQKEMAPDVNYMRVLRAFGKAEADRVASTKPSQTEQETLAQAKQIAKDNGWSWGDVVEKARQQLGLDTDFLKPDSNEARQLAAFRKADKEAEETVKRTEAMIAESQKELLAKKQAKEREEASKQEQAKAERDKQAEERARAEEAADEDLRRSLTPKTYRIYAEEKTKKGKQRIINEVAVRSGSRNYERIQRVLENPPPTPAPPPPVQRDVTKPEQMTPEEFEKMRSEIVALYDESAMPPKSEAQKKAEFKVQMLEGELKRARTLEGNQARGVRRSRGAVKSEADLQAELDAAKTLVDREKKAWDDERKAKTERLWSELQARHPEAVQSRLVYRDMYEGKSEVMNKVGLPSAGKDFVRKAVKEKAPVSAAAVDAYKITLPEGYVRQGDLYVFQPPTPPTDATPQREIPENRVQERQAPDEGGTTPEAGGRNIAEKGGTVSGEEVAQVGDEVAWMAAGKEAQGTIYRIRGDVADIEYFGPKTVPLSELHIVRKSNRRLAQEKKALETAAAPKNSQEPEQPKPKSKFTKAEIASLEQGKTPEGWTVSSKEPVTVTDTKGKTWEVKVQFSPARTITLISGGEVQTFDVQTSPQPKPAAEVETPVAEVPAEEVNAKMEELLKAPTKSTGKPAVKFKTQTEESAFRRGFQAAVDKPGAMPPAEKTGLSPKDRKWDDAWRVGWAQGQTFVRSKAPTSEFGSTNTVVTKETKDKSDPTPGLVAAWTRGARDRLRLDPEAKNLVEDFLGEKLSEDQVVAFVVSSAAVLNAEEKGVLAQDVFSSIREEGYAADLIKESWSKKTQAGIKDFGSTNTVVTKETKDKAAKNLRKKIGGQTNVGLDPSILKDAITIGAFYIEGGARSFADFSAAMLKDFGAGVQKYIRPAYEALRKRTDIDTAGMDSEEGGEPAARVEEPEAPPPAPPPPAPEPKAAPAETEEPAAVAIANDPVDVQREALGLPPIMRQTQEAYTFPQMWSDAEAAMTANPKRGEALVTELNSTPRTISALEDAILLRERVNRVNALDLAMVEFNKAPKGNNEMQRRAMDDAITALTQLDDALNVAGTEQGRSLNARKMLAKLDYTLPKMLTTLRAANEGDLSEADVAMVTRLQKQLAETQKKLAEAEKRQSEFSQERFDEIAAAAKEEGRKEALREIEEKAQVQAAKVAELTKRKAEFQEAKKKPSVLDEILKAAEARIASRRGKLYSDVLMLNAAADAADYVLIGAVKIAKGITKFADWVASMKESDPSLADDQMEQLFKEAKAFHDGEVQAEETPLKTRKAKAPVIDKIKTIAADGEELDSRTIYNFVVEKVKERSVKTPKAEMTDKDLVLVIQEVTKDVQQFFPNTTEREIRDLFSGYGKILMPSQDELSKQVRQLSALGKLVSAIEDAKAQRAPLKSGPQRDKATQAIRLKQKELARALRMNGVEYAADEEQLRSPLDAIKARLNNQINDLALEINTRKKTPRRPSVAYDKETEELVKLRDELKSISDFVNAPAGPTFSELVDEEMKKLDKRIAELQKTLDEKKFAPKEDQTLYTQELQAKRDERDRLSKLVSKARKQAVGDVRTQDEIDRAAIKDARDAIAELERKIKEKNFTRPERRTPTETAEYKALTEEKERLQKILRDERLKAEGRQGPTDEQRIKQATTALDKSMERIQKMLDSGKYDAPKRVSKTPETPELKAKREARDLLRKQLEELRKAKREAEIDPIAKQIATDKKRIQTRMDKLKKRMADGDFSKPVKRQKAVDKELLDLQVEEEKLKEEWAKMVFERQLASRGPGKKILDTLQQALNTSRAILTSVDVSAVLRQGGFIVLGNPLRGLRNLGPMFQAFGSEEFARQEKFRLENRENFKNGLYQQSKLFLSDTGKVNQMNKQEEQFMTRWLDKIPKGIKGGYIGSVLRGSQRAYTVFLNRLRADSFDAMVGNLKKGAEPTPEESKAVADYINIATGRGDLWKATQAATFLNTVFFAPRLVASRFQILAGYPYFTASGRTKALVLREYAKFLTGASVVYALGMLAQGEDDEPIETDPRSSDFAKIRFGDTRVDPLGGLIQATVFVSRVIAGEKKTSKGEIVPLRPEFRFMNLFRETPRTDKVKFGGDVTSDVAKKFLQSKLSPIVGSVVNVLDMRTVVGEDADPMTEAERMVVPMSFTEMKETFEAQGVPEGTALTILQLFGMGVQTYTPGKK